MNWFNRQLVSRFRSEDSWEWICRTENIGMEGEKVALSEHEKQVLAEMEAALAADDPRLADNLRKERRSPHLTYVLGGIGLILAGMAIIIGGLVAKVSLIGIIGFLVSLGGAFVMLQSGRVKVTQKITEGKVKGHKAKRTLSAIMEERWERRRWQQ